MCFYTFLFTVCFVDDERHSWQLSATDEASNDIATCEDPCVPIIAIESFALFSKTNVIRERKKLLLRCLRGERRINIESLIVNVLHRSLIINVLRKFQKKICQIFYKLSDILFEIFQINYFRRNNFPVVLLSWKWLCTYITDRLSVVLWLYCSYL